MTSTINSRVIGTIIYLVLFNIFLFYMSIGFVENDKIPEFINEPLQKEALGDYDTPSGLGLIKTLTFGYFISVEAIEEKDVRIVLRTILTLIFQMIPLLILAFAGLDYIRGI